MVAYQSNPEKQNPDDISPALHELGYRIAETATVDPPHTRKQTVRHPRRHGSSRTTDADSALDPYWNVVRDPYTPEQEEAQWQVNHSGAAMAKAALRAHREEAAQKNARKVEATPEELAAQHEAAVEGWPEETGETFNTLDDPAWAWKRPHER